MSISFYIAENWQLYIGSVFLCGRRAQWGGSGARQLWRQEGPWAVHGTGQQAEGVSGQGAGGCTEDHWWDHRESEGQSWFPGQVPWWCPSGKPGWTAMVWGRGKLFFKRN